MTIAARKNDVWRSTDNGATWTQVNASAGWTARVAHSSVVMPDGSIVLMGGYDGSSNKNDVWRFMPAGSSAQNPSHTYTMPGTYRSTAGIQCRWIQQHAEDRVYYRNGIIRCTSSSGN